MEEVVIVGAGVAGLATAVTLKKVGVRALVLERSEGLRATGTALSLFPNAWLALDALGVRDKLTALYTPIVKGYVTDISSKTIQELRYSAENGGENGVRTVHRKVLLEALAEEMPPNTIRFSSKLISIGTARAEDGSSICIISLDDGTKIKSKVVIACDGVHSAVARWLGLGTPIDSGRYAVRGLTVFHHGHGLSTEVRQFVKVGIRAGFVPLNDKEVYWFFTGKRSNNKEVATEMDPKSIQSEISEHLAKDFPSIYLDIVRQSDLPTLTWAPLMFRRPWDVIVGTMTRANIVVAGDAMHPMTPDLGQGACLALEDAVVLGRHIGNSIARHDGKLVSREVGLALESYVKERRWRVATLTTASFLSGWVQQDGSNWWMKFLRDAVFYKLMARIAKAVYYDCGKLPRVTNSST